MGLARADEHEQLLKMSRLHELTGVPVATIKFYIRERLLPRPTVKTSRNMAYYHPSFVERIRMIQRLKERHLPLRVIRQLLSELEAASSAERHTLADLAPALAAVLSLPGGELVGERELLRRYPEASAERLGVLVELGLLRPTTRAGERHYDADDVRLLDALHRAHEAGFSPDRFPVEDLGHYALLLGELAERELHFFARHATARMTPREARRLVDRAMEASEPLVLLIRRKLLRAALERALIASRRRGP